VTQASRNDRLSQRIPATNPLATFRLDVAYRQIAPAFTAAGINTILLKGPAFDQLLFDGTRARAYSDIDLLTSPRSVPEAERLMEELGFRRAVREPAVGALARRVGVVVGLDRPAHATAWIRDRDRFIVDLHHTLPQTGASAEQTWRVLGGHRVSITVAGVSVETLDRPASALLIALHAAHHGPRWRRARADLRRACATIDRECWRDAARLARELRAERSIGIGLGTTQEGVAIAAALGLRTVPTPADRFRWAIGAWRERGRATR
jgi:hypothetical protein